MKDIKRRMSDAHEEFLVRLFGGRQTRGSGNQAANPMDGRHSHVDEQFAFAWDGKSTLAKTISVGPEMWGKAELQSHGERPSLPLRFYANERLREEECLDLVVISAHDLAEMRERLLELG